MSAGLYLHGAEWSGRVGGMENTEGDPGVGLLAEVV